jgi:hypothetical protein
MKKNTPLHTILILLTLLALTSIAAHGGGGVTLVTTLSGAQEINPTTGNPGAGDPDGSGFASIELDPEEGVVCWRISFKGIEAPFAAHIHVAPKGSNGPVVVPLSPITSGCTTADPALIQAIIDSPEQYYVNVHNTPYPGGALRGQLGAPAPSKPK